MKNETIKKLKTMRLPAFAEAYQNQADNETEYQSLSFHERLALMVDAEYDSRHNNNIKRLPDSPTPPLSLVILIILRTAI